MDADRFDALARAVSTATTRRAALGALAGLGLARFLGRATPTAAEPRAEPGCVGIGESCSVKFAPFTLCCSGCCDEESGVCVDGTDPERCGAGGGLTECTFCDVSPPLKGLICQQGGCCFPNGSPCGGDSYGCCDAGAVCTGEPGQEVCCPRSRRCLAKTGNFVCCEPGQECKGRRGCVCDEAACKKDKGCCLANHCQAGDTPERCGSDGKRCKKCPKGLDCVEDKKDGRVCRCIKGGYLRCAGCCSKDKTRCNPGTTATACGSAGQVCKDCTAKGPGWVCQSKTCCKKSGACPAGCPKDGACKGCCGGKCTGGKCEAEARCIAGSCGDGCCDEQTGVCRPGTEDGACGWGVACWDCALPPYGGPDRGICCDRRCSPNIEHCGGCGKNCNPMANKDADRCVDGQCRCGDGPPCSCLQGTFCNQGRCRCLADPGFSLCTVGTTNGSDCVSSSIGGDGPCPGGAAPICTCTEGDEFGNCLTPA